MRRNLALIVLLLAAPAAAFLVAVNRSVPLVPLHEFDAQCAVCGRKATRTLASVAEGLRTRRVYVYRRSEYPGGVPAWCDRHGPDKLKANAGVAYLTALTTFAVAAGISIRIRNGW